MINFGGISSGMDTQAIIDAMVGAQRQPINRLKAKSQGYSAQISNIGRVKSSLSELSSLMEDMRDVSNVLAFDATSSDEEVLTANMDGAASAGSYDITVSELASAEKDRSVALSSEFEPVKAGTMTITAAGEDPVDVIIEDGDTVNDVVRKINASGAGVDASLLSDGTNTFIQLVAKETGYEVGGQADDAITISESYTGADGAEIGFAQVTQATNAELEIDGMSISSRTNTLTDIIEDVSLELTGKGSSELTIAADRDGTKEQLTAFVDKYNDVLDQIRSQTRTADGARSSDADPALTRLETELRGLIGRGVSGSPGSYGSLSEVGITTGTDGKLELDDKTIDSAMNRDLRSIGDLFTLADEGIAAKFIELTDVYTDSTDGVLGQREGALRDRIDDNDDQITRLEARLEKVTKNLEKRFTAMEQAMANTQYQGSMLSAIIPGMG